MNVYFPKSATKRLDAKLAYIKGKGSQNLANAIAGEIAEGNDHDRLAGLDRHGKPQTPVKPRKGRYRGASGPPLAPFGKASRVIANFRSIARRRGGLWQIVAGWEGVVSKSGIPFLPFHDQGIRSRPGKTASSPKGAGIIGRIFHRLKQSTGFGWFLPRRPIFGISPRTWRRINQRINTFKQKARKIK